MKNNEWLYCRNRISLLAMELDLILWSRYEEQPQPDQRDDRGRGVEIDPRQAGFF